MLSGESSGVSHDEEARLESRALGPPEVQGAPEGVFRTLGQSRRRLATYFLLQRDIDTDVREMARHVAAWENDKPVEAVTPEERRRVYTSLQQNHLPKMDEYGFIEYDADRHAIESADGVDTLADYMDTIPGTDVPWCLYYIAIGAAGTFLAALAGTGTLAFGGGTLTVLLSGLVLGSGLLHAYSERECWVRCD